MVGWCSMGTFNDPCFLCFWCFGWWNRLHWGKRQTLSVAVGKWHTQELRLFNVNHANRKCKYPKKAEHFPCLHFFRLTPIDPADWIHWILGIETMITELVAGAQNDICDFPCPKRWQQNEDRQRSPRHFSIQHRQERCCQIPLSIWQLRFVDPFLFFYFPIGSTRMSFHPSPLIFNTPRKRGKK